MTGTGAVGEACSRRNTFNHTMSDEIANLNDPQSYSELMKVATFSPDSRAEELSIAFTKYLNSDCVGAIGLYWKRAQVTDSPRDSFVTELIDDVQEVARSEAKALYQWFSDKEQKRTAELEVVSAGRGRGRQRGSTSSSDSRAAKRREGVDKKLLAQLEALEATINWVEW